MDFQTINPATEEVISSYSFDSSDQVELTIERGHKTYKRWSSLNIQERISFIQKVNQELLNRLDKGAQLITKEMGKPISEAKAEIQKCRKMISYYCENSESFLKDKSVDTAHQKSFVSYQPQGIILGIMPWNFPLWQALRFAIPSLIVGNCVIVKHAPNVQGCQDFLQGIFDEVLKQQAAFQTIKVDVSAIEGIISDRRIRGVSFTGSEKAGRIVSSLAGKHLKKAVLELGGSDAYIVLKDADLKKAALSCVTSRFINNGQSCVAAKRWIVEKEVIEDFKSLVIEEMKKLKLGSPTQSDTRLGPMARLDLKDNLKSQLDKSIERGAKCSFESQWNEERGYFFPPTLLTSVKPGQPAFDEEIFGPVACLIEAKDEREAIDLANQSNYGLGGAVFSKDIDKAQRIAREEIDSGGVFINDFYKSVPELPFGGVKASGIGRELAKEALLEFANIKTVSIP